MPGRTPCAPTIRTALNVPSPTSRNARVLTIHPARIDYSSSDEARYRTACKGRVRTVDGTNSFYRRRGVVEAIFLCVDGMT